MILGDWSSDVCSSDLFKGCGALQHAHYESFHLSVSGLKNSCMGSHWNITHHTAHREIQFAGHVEGLPMFHPFGTITKHSFGLADGGGIKTSHICVYSREGTGHTEEGDKHKYTGLLTTALPLRTYILPVAEPAFPLAEPCTLPALGTVLALLLWQIL